MSAPLCGVNENGQLEKSYIADGMPIGAVFPFYGTTPPAHTLACNGAAISRTAYAELFAVIGTTAGAGDGSTTFNVPDLRGMFIRGTGGNAAALGVEQGDAIRELIGSFTITGRYDGVTGFGTFPVQDLGGSCEVSFMAVGMNVTSYTSTETAQPAGVRFRASKTVPTAAENRPVNVAMTYCIIYEN